MVELEEPWRASLRHRLAFGKNTLARRAGACGKVKEYEVE